MGFFSRLFGRRDPPAVSPAPQPEPLTAVLLKSYIDGDLNRQKLHVETESARHTFELKKLEIEMANLETIAAEKRKDQVAREEARAARRTAAENARARRADKRAGGTASRSGAPPFMSNCEDCKARLERRKPTHNNDMLRHAQQGHEEALTRFLNDAAPKASDNLN